MFKEIVISEADREKILERFERHYTPDPNSGCWLWLNHLNVRGYGAFSIKGINYIAHRVSHELFNGHVPTDKLIMHKCDNPCCVNPNHLVVGTDLENNQDRDSKGRNHQANKTHCKRGHEFTEDNIYPVKLRNGVGFGRECRKCKRLLGKLRHEKRRPLAPKAEQFPEEPDLKNPPCVECGAMTAKEAETKCNCFGENDQCHGCELWPDGIDKAEQE